ncbi:MAG: 50S ribosomal protein L11 methyltransferase [Opitutaceae bacterium]|nr:50S ribosomal protein L11 methyltransferase [Opitutaceae bacterium]
MAVFEFKAEIALPAIGALEERLAEREEQRFMVLEDKPSGRAWLAGYFAAREEALDAWRELAAGLGVGVAVGETVVRQLPDEDWKESYKVHFKAWKFGRLNWVPVWERGTFAPPSGEEVLWLDPGMAFGTGNHETTRLVVERLVAIAAREGIGARVLDAGCGSGILALSALKLGFAEVAGFDNDPEAVRISRENAELNGLSRQADFFVGDLDSGLAGAEVGVLLANIQADVLGRFASGLVRAVAPGGHLILSGILGRELESVRAAFAPLTTGWSVESRELGEWADLAFCRPRLG